MLDKIVISKDRKRATVHYSTHSVHLSSDEDVMVLIYELVFQPSEQNAELWAEKERRYINSLEDTAIIDISKIDEDAA